MKLNPFRKKNLLKIDTFAYEMYVNDDVPVTVSVKDFVYDPDTKECRFRYDVFDAMNRVIPVPPALHDELYRDIVKTLMTAIAGSLNEPGN